MKTRGKQRELTTLEDLQRTELESLYRNEQSLAESLDRFRQSAQNWVLAESFERERRKTEELATALRECLQHEPPATTGRESLKAILIEANQRVGRLGDHHLVDAELIATIQKILHFQIAEYGTLKTLASLLDEQGLVSLAESAIDQKIECVQILTELALHQVHWRAVWWTPQHSSAWERAKEAFKKDWQASFTRSEHQATDTLKHLKTGTSAASRDEILLTEEPAFRYGYGAAIHYHGQSWSEAQEQLKTNYGGHWQTSVEHIRSGWDYQREKAALSEVV